ncbi:MAG: hypothetical protein WBO88_12630, partial [Candidatus Dechloromonas phosphoritropha]
WPITKRFNWATISLGFIGHSLACIQGRRKAAQIRLYDHAAIVKAAAQPRHQFCPFFTDDRDKPAYRAPARRIVNNG